MSSPPLPHKFMLPPLPEMRSATVFGRTIRYYDVGSGAPLLLIHGIGGDADDWAFCIAPLSASHRVIALDLIGFGRSDKPVINYCIEGFVEVLGRFLRTLHIERVTMIGGSLGGWIAAAFALKHPAAVEKLVLVDAAGVWGETTRLPIDLHVSTRAHMREIFELLFYDKSLATDDLIDLAYQQHLERGDGSTIHSVLQDERAVQERLDETIAQLKMPVLLVWGEQDKMIPVATGRRMQQLIAGSTLEVIPECGHLPALEKPTEFVSSVLEFLRR